jgi:hypothetical protein
MAMVLCCKFGRGQHAYGLILTAFVVLMTVTWCVNLVVTLIASIALTRGLTFARVARSHWLVAVVLNSNKRTVQRRAYNAAFDIFLGRGACVLRHLMRLTLEIERRRFLMIVMRRHIASGE